MFILVALKRYVRIAKILWIITDKLACILEASESTRLRMGESLPIYHEDHIAGKGEISLQHYNLVHKFIPMPQAMKIPAAKAAVDKEWEKLEKISAWNLTMYAYSSNTRQLGCVFQDMEPPKSSSILRKSSHIRKPIRCVRFTKAVVRHASIRDQNPSLEMICPGEPQQRNPNAPKFEDRSQEEREWQERCAREAAWRLATNIFKSLPSSTSMTPSRQEVDHPTSSSSSSSSPTTTVSSDSETRAREDLCGIDSHPVSVSSKHVERKERGDLLTKSTKNQNPNKKRRTRF